ncbi:MAG: hypothetical protein GY769_22030 [bacterium]|nr:hypothetical protein [bacterium]
MFVALQEAKDEAAKDESGSDATRSIPDDSTGGYDFCASVERMQVDDVAPPIDTGSVTVYVRQLNPKEAIDEQCRTTTFWWASGQPHEVKQRHANS